MTADEPSSGADEDPLLVLPDGLRGAFKDPLGPVETDPERVLEDVTGPLVAVGDVVTYHFERVGRTPDVAVVDGRTKREAVEVVGDDVPDGDQRPGHVFEDALRVGLDGAERVFERTAEVVRQYQ